MGSLFKMGGGNKTINQDVPEPEKVAEPTDIGGARKAEDDALFGGKPDLRVERSATPPSLETSGSGLKLM